jgi:hypothetical protein
MSDKDVPCEPSENEGYPGVVTNQHIPTPEIERDIADTEREISTMEREAEALDMLGDRMSDIRRRARLHGIEDRKIFIAKLKAILEARNVLGSVRK